MKNSKNRGFTFIELILYMAILGIFMVAVVTLVASAVNTNRKEKARQKLQTQATETYDTISGMVMGASNIKIVGVGSIGSGTSYVRTASGAIADLKTSQLSCFMVPGENTIKESSTMLLKMKTPSGSIQQEIIGDNTVKDSSLKLEKCYDIADLKPFDENIKSVSESDIKKEIKKDEAAIVDVRYLWIEYTSDYAKASGKVVKDADSQIIYNQRAFCTVSFDEKNHQLFIYRNEVNDNDYKKWELAAGSSGSAKDEAIKNIQNKQAIINGQSMDGTLLAKNVESFQLQVNPSNNSVVLMIGFKDERTGQTYDATGIVGIRNSFVLKKHEWN